jgi:hypothetical protein
VIVTCPADTPCCRCKALIPAGVQAAKARRVARFDGRLEFDCWFHLACVPPEYRGTSPATYSVGRAPEK